jgi:hypothetical protein
VRRTMASRLPALIGLLFCLLSASCANDEAAAGNDKRGGFYGGINGGGVWP